MKIPWMSTESAENSDSDSVLSAQIFALVLDRHWRFFDVVFQFMAFKSKCKSLTPQLSLEPFRNVFFSELWAQRKKRRNKKLYVLSGKIQKALVLLDLYIFEQKCRNVIRTRLLKITSRVWELPRRRHILPDNVPKMKKKKKRLRNAQTYVSRRQNLSSSPPIKTLCTIINIFHHLLLKAYRPQKSLDFE